MTMPEQHRTGFFETLRFRYGLTLAGFIAITGYYLWKTQGAHMVDYLPLILLSELFVAMSFFMHSVHGHGNRDKSRNFDQPR